MKKRCTASACRRLFNSRYDFCPYCGKEYPQIKALWDVWLTGYTGKIKCIKLYRGLFGSGLAETKEKVERVLRGEPLLFGSALSRAAAEELVGQIRDAGGIAEVRAHGRKAPPVEIKKMETLRDVWLTGYNEEIKCIRLYSRLFNKGFVESKKKVESLLRGEPLLFGSSLSCEAAEELVGQITDAGGIAQVRAHGRKAPKAPPVEKIIKAEKPVKISLPIEELGLSVRTINCLTRAGIKTTDDLVRMTEEELIKVRNLGRKSLEEILITLESVGLYIMEEE